MIHIHWWYYKGDWKYRHYNNKTASAKDIPIARFICRCGKIKNVPIEENLTELINLVESKERE